MNAPTSWIDVLYASLTDSTAWAHALRTFARAHGAAQVTLVVYDDADDEPRSVEGDVPRRIAPRGAPGGVMVADDDARTVVLWLTGPAVRHPAPSALAHLRRACALRERLWATERREAALAATFARVNLAVLVVDAAGRVLERSRPAGELLASGCGLTLDADDVLRSVRDGDAVLDRPGTAVGDAAERMLRIGRDGRPDLSVLVWPLAVGAWRMVVLCDPGFAARIELDLVAAEAGLSPREAQVAAGLCAGRDVTAIAREIGIAVNTVRSHQRTLYGKTGARTQRELVRRVVGSPAALFGGVVRLTPPPGG